MVPVGKAAVLAELAELRADAEPQKRCLPMLADGCRR
jgi:hypothetical protein